MFNCKYVLKILVLALTGIMLMSISAVSAQEAESNFNTPSPGNAALRSLMLPGWGQFFNEQPTKGYIFAGAEIIALGTAYMMYSSADSAYEDYEKQRTGSAYDDYSSKVDSANMFIYAAAAIWVGNVIDAYFSADSGPSKKKSTIKKSPKKKKVKVEEEIEEEEAEEEEAIDEEDEEEAIKPVKKQKKQIAEEVEEEEEQPAEEEEEEYEEEEEEEDESRLPERGFYLQAKGLHQLGIAYRYTF